jgi:pimeloyl-ACP methyl ester carboxylesterase
MFSRASEARAGWARCPSRSSAEVLHVDASAKCCARALRSVRHDSFVAGGVVVSATTSDLHTAFADNAPAEQDVFLKGVELRPGVTADVHLRVLHDPRAGREAIVAIHGASTTASGLVNLGKTLLASNGARARWFVAIDQVGHGKSPPPVGAVFGELGLQDYVATVLGTLARLKEVGLRATTLMGHSMGGATVLLTQQTLVQRGQSLREAYGVEHVVALAPAGWLPDATPAITQNAALGAAFEKFQGVDPTLGPCLRIDAEALLMLAWGRPDGSLPPGAPSVAQVADAGWVAPEAAVAIGNLMGAPNLPRAVFDAGTFVKSRGTRLSIVSFQHDILIMPDENKALYAYVTGENPDQGWARIDGADATHGMPITQPAEMLAALEGRLTIP